MSYRTSSTMRISQKKLKAATAAAATKLAATDGSDEAFEAGVMVGASVTVVVGAIVAGSIKTVSIM